MASGEHSRAEAINNRGEVVGVAGDRPFIWTASTGAEPFLGDFVGTALDINDRGEVVGHYATAGPPGGFLWSRQSGFVDLGDFIPYEINEQGQIAGQCSPTAEACIWDEGAITRLGNLGASGSVGLGINDAGEVVGYSNTRGRVTHPFLWTPLAGMIDLGAADHSQAAAINNRGQVTGYRCCPLAATVWSRGRVRVPNTSAITEGVDINESGVVVGLNWTSGHAFVWAPPGRPLGLPGLPDSDFGQATGINDRGVVVGIEGGPNGLARAVMWTRKPATLTVTTPNNPARWGLGTTQRLGWTYDGDAPNSKSRSAGTGGEHGTTWRHVANEPGGFQNFFWEVTSPSPSPHDSESSQSETLMASMRTTPNIRIASATIEMLRPTAETSVEVGAPLTIFYKHWIGPRAPVAIDISSNNGATWRTVAETSTTGSTTSSFHWVR